MDSNKNPTADLLNILDKAMDANMYGSVEVYLEDGQITQITQRIIKKIKRTKSIQKPKDTSSLPHRNGEEVTMKFSN